MKDDLYYKNLLYLSMNVRLPASLHANLFAMRFDHAAGAIGAYRAAEVFGD